MPSKALQISAVLFATFTVIDVHIGAMRRWTPNAIVIPDNAHRTERVAADELAHYIALATNVNVHIVTESQAGNARKAIWLGRTKCAQLPREFERLPHEVMRDAFVIKRVGNDVALYGGSPRGTLFAVYRYLERAFGWRWLQPDAGGESLTDEYDPQFPRYRMIEIPHFAIRGLVRPWAGVQRWYAKLGLNYALIPVKWGNLSGKRLEWILDASLSVELGEHCFSVYSPKGKMLCPHDISTLEHALRKLNELVRANPMVETFGIWPEDGIFVFCQCEQCGKFHPLETLDERYLRIINWLAEKALGHHPKIRIGFLAYNQYRQPPRGAKVFAKNTVLAYAAPIGFASITDRKRYQRFVHGLRKWLKCGVKRIWVYEYFNCSDDIVRMSALFPHVIGREIRMLLRTGASGLMSQIDNP
ncbi:MAG TPA: DUF4838 domain-containing protein, partial [Armatimonadetes bacterium]|nr:DUF4838 domain-containing protein [Armatimonadota bacterium]